MIRGDKLVPWFCAVLFALFACLVIGRDLLFQSLLLLSSDTHYAQVVSTHQGEHNTCTYKLTVRQVDYTAKGDDCGRYPAGTLINVYYWPSNPAITTSRPPGGLELVRPLAFLASTCLVFLITLRKVRRDFN